MLVDPIDPATDDADLPGERGDCLNADNSSPIWASSTLMLPSAAVMALCSLLRRSRSYACLVKVVHENHHHLLSAGFESEVSEKAVGASWPMLWCSAAKDARSVHPWD